MNPVVFHIAGGDVFFTGVGCIGVGVGLAFHSRSWVRRVGTLLLVLGLIAVTISATPLPYWFYGMAGMVSVVWMIIAGKDKMPAKCRYIAAILTAAVWLMGLGMELPYHFSPTVKAEGTEPIVIYGDSLTAGLGEGEAETWPSLLKQEYQAEVRDFSRVGATVGSVLKKVRAEPPSAGIVILEIGGNDILGNTTAADFARDLDSLLQFVSRDRQFVVMFELPLLPFYNEYGLAQRRLARRYGVSLVPKRVLLGILADDEATLDSIHLTQAGHRRMATTVWRTLGRDEP